MNLSRGSKKVSILKTLSWRVVATLATVLIAWIVTGNIASGLKIGGVEVFAKMALYYFHERAWAYRLSPQDK